ncbi:MAG: N-acetyl-gamma-glutamyl-phosphate reductase [Bdellovibrionota bacterium]
MVHKYETKAVPAAIVGIRGYSGLELAGLLLKHPGVELKAGFSSDPGFNLGDYLEDEKATQVSILSNEDIVQTAREFETLFLATPPKTSLDLAPKLLEAGCRVIDLSGAFRLKKGSTEERIEKYQKWYKLEHNQPELLSSAHYGLVPWGSPEALPSVRFIANPGCYATSVLMALLPLVKEKLIELNTIVIDAKSGTSGAGKKAEENLLFAEVAEDCTPYKVAQHQHLPEIREMIERYTGETIDPMFSTTLLPIKRGITTAIYARLSARLREEPLSSVVERIDLAYEKFYADYPLLKWGLLQEEPGRPSPLSLKRVVGSARTRIRYAAEGDKLFVFSMIDNLLKGAASQAIENFNLIHGLPLLTGLT